MPSSGYFDTVFGVDGTIVTVPDAIQGDGSVSYAQGFGVDYTLPNSNPSYKYIPQGQFNQLFYDITSAVQAIQQGTAPAWITSTMNGGSPYSYPKYATVSKSGVTYISLSAANTDTPPSANWGILPLGQGRYFGSTSTGSANAQVISTGSGLTAFTNNMEFTFIAGYTNSGDATLAIDSIAATHLYANSASGLVTLGANQIFTGNVYTAKWDGTNLVVGVQPNLNNYLQASNNLSDVNNAATSRSNISAAKSGANTDITSLSAPALGAATATTQAAGTSNTTVATTAFAAGSSNAAANGHVVLPGGIIFQWGSAANTGTSYSFDISFPNNCFQVIPQLNYSAGGVNASYVQVASKSTSGFTTGSDVGSGNLTWWAIGN